MPSREPGTSPTRLTNSNGEYRDGSSNKTPHMVVPIPRPPLVAHRTQLFRANWVVDREGREKARARRLYCGMAGDSRGGRAENGVGCAVFAKHGLKLRLGPKYRRNSLAIVYPFQLSGSGVRARNNFRFARHPGSKAGGNDELHPDLGADYGRGGYDFLARQGPATRQTRAPRN